MPCPKCGSDDWKLASLVYKEGLSHIETSTTGSAIGMSPAGISSGAGKAKTSGTHQTELSKLAAPPSGMVFTTFCGGAAFVCGILAWLLSSWWLALVTVACIVGVVRFWKPESAQHAKEMEQWRKTRMCQRCGHFYSQD